MLRLVKEKWHRLLPIVFLALFALSRWPGLFPPSFSAAYALVFCAGVYLPKRLSLWLPLAVMLVTDIGLNLYYEHTVPGYNVWNGPNLASVAFNYVGYTALNLLARRFKPQSSFVALLGGGILGAILFYLITNIASWFLNPEYTKTLVGLIRALTIGTSGWPTTLEFFRNTLLSGGLFAGLFVAAMKLTAPAESPQEKEAGYKAPEAEADPEEAPEEAKA